MEEMSVQALWQDLRYAIRMLAKNPGFTALAVLSMAIGIGLNTAAFSIIDWMFLRPLSIQSPKQMVTIHAVKQDRYRSFSFAEYKDICRQSATLEGIVASFRTAAELDKEGEREAINAEAVSGNYFAVLGVDAAFGRTFGATEKWSNTEDTPVVLGYGLWQRRFASDPGIVGKKIILNRRDAVVLGVAPPEFSGVRKRVPVPTEVWFPAELPNQARALQRREDQFFELFGRMRQGVPLQMVRTEMNAIAHDLANAYPSTNNGISYRADTVEMSFSKNLVISTLLLAGPVLILVICCTNVSGMMLAQAEGRRNEIAVRLALGSSPRRLLRQLLTESLLISLVGAGLGLIVSFWLIGMLPALLPSAPIYMHLDLRMDVRVLLYTLSAAIAASLMSGLLPAFQSIKTDAGNSLKTRMGKNEGGGNKLGLRKILAAGEIAISLVLLVATGLFLKSLLISNQVDLGIDSKKKLLILHVIPSFNPEESGAKFYLPVIAQIRSVPGVKNAAYARHIPLRGIGGGAACEVEIPGVDFNDGPLTIGYNAVGRNYFTILGTRIMSGRAFDDTDELPDRRTVIINQTMAQRFWAKSNPIGAHVIVGGKEYQVIGIAQDNKLEIHKPPSPFVYLSQAQFPSRGGVVLVETAGNPSSFAFAVRQKILGADKMATMMKPETLEDVMDLAYYQERIQLLASGAIGILGIILSATGLYAVMAYLTRRRTHEIGIRMSLGARHCDISRWMLESGLKMCCIGIAVGLFISVSALRLIAGLLYGVAPTDIWVLSGCSIVVLGVALLASYIPARRAARVNPMAALRYE